MKKLLMLLFMLGTLSLTAASAGHKAQDTSTPKPAPTSSATLSPVSKQPPVLKNPEPATDQQKPSGTQPTKSDEPEEIGDDETVRINTALVTIPLSVMDRSGRYVADLRREELRIYEDGVEQEVTFFASLEKPFTVALLLDISDSAVFRLEEVKDAAVAFVDQLRPDDRAIVITFDKRMDILARATSDKETLRQAIRGIKLGAGTSLYNAVDMTLKQIFSRIEGRKAVVLFTDGVDTSSMGATFQSNLRDAAESDSLIYTVQYELSSSGKRYDAGMTGKSTGWTEIGVVGRAQRITANKYLYLIAERTGGRQFLAKSVEAMRKSFASIAEELRHQYSLGYYPQRSAQAGRQRLVKVRVARPNLIARSRKSYFYNPPERETPDDGLNQR